MVYIVAFAAMYATSLILGVIWNLVLFKAQYRAAVGQTLRDAPIFPIGLTAIALNCAAIITVFSWLYPAGTFAPLWGIVLLGLLWAPNLVNSLAAAAKLKVASPAPYIGLEAGFSALSAVILGLILSGIFARFG